MRRKLRKPWVHEALIGHRNYEPGAHMYHAATGVADSSKQGRTNEKQHKFKKAYARLRSYNKDHYDEGTHSYMISRDDAARESVY